MAAINKTAIVAYSPKQMFDLVNDINTYSDFLPHCVESEVLEEDVDEVKAKLTLAFSGMQKSFTTSNHLQPHKMIEVRLVEGPFHHLEGFWRFEDLGENACKIILDLEFEIAGKLFSMMFGPLFAQVANSLVDAFVTRAKEVYGANELSDAS